MQQPLEKLLAFQTLKAFLKKEDWTLLANNLGLNAADLKRTQGKNVEDSFFLMAYTYEVVENIIVFNEALAKLTATPSPDGMLIFNDGTRILVEIKSTQEKQWKITKGRMNRQKLLAEKIGIKLIYAISISGYWGMFDTDFIESNGYKIEFPKDIGSSLLDEQFDARLILIPSGLQIVKHYGKNPNEELLNPYPSILGYLQKYEIRYEGNVFKIVNEFQLLAMTAIEASLTNEPQVIKVSEQLHVVSQSFDRNTFTYDYNFILEPIYRTTSSTTGDFLDSSTFISNALTLIGNGKLGFMKYKNDALKFLLSMQASGIPFKLIKLNEIDSTTLTWSQFENQSHPKPNN